jgi:hypothetical protein
MAEILSKNIKKNPSSPSIDSKDVSENGTIVNQDHPSKESVQNKGQVSFKLIFSEFIYSKLFFASST